MKREKLGVVRWKGDRGDESSEYQVQIGSTSVCPDVLNMKDDCEPNSQEDPSWKTSTAILVGLMYDENDTGINAS